jgi:hypothetical protein
MIRVKWCRECGRLSAYNFSFCPWCGREFTEMPEAEETVDRAFERIEDGLENGLESGARNRLEEAERRLAQLDRDLGDFLGGAGEGELNRHETLPIPDHLPGGP